QALEAKAESPSVAPADDLSWGEVRTILHAELAALPERFREPLLLCCLEGLTQHEAGRRLGWTAATVKGPLPRGRERLRGRLGRRGLGLAAVLEAVGLTGQALAAPLPAALLRAAVPTRGATPPATAAALARGILGPLMPAKLPSIAAALLLASALGAGVALLPQVPADGEPAPAGAEAAAGPTPARNEP